MNGASCAALVGLRPRHCSRRRIDLRCRTCSSPTSPRPPAIDFKHENSATSNKYLIETMGGGVALLDYDNDGRLDMFFTNGARIDDPHAGGQAARQVGPEVLEPAVPAEERRHVRRRDGEGRSQRRAAEPLRHGRRRSATTTTTASRTSTSPATAATRSIATTATARSPTSPTSARVGAGGWSASAGFFDYDNDGRLDLFVTRYLEWTLPEATAIAGRRSPATAPTVTRTTSTGATNLLYRNNGDGTFTDVSAKAGIAGGAGQGPGRRVRRLRPRRLRRRLCGQRLGAVASCTTTTGRHVHRGRPARGRRVQRGRQDLRRHGRGLRRLRQRRPPRHLRHRPLERALPAVPPERRRQLPRRHEHVRRGRAPRCRSRAGARASSTTTTTAGRTSSSPRDT